MMAKITNYDDHLMTENDDPLAPSSLRTPHQSGVRAKKW